MVHQPFFYDRIKYSLRLSDALGSFSVSIRQTWVLKQLVCLEAEKDVLLTEDREEVPWF